MNHACPHCQTLIRAQEITINQPHALVIAGDASLFCPACHGGLRINPHPHEWMIDLLISEVGIYVIGMITFIIAVLLAIWLGWAGFVIAIAGGLIAPFAIQHAIEAILLARWPRYRAAHGWIMPQRQICPLPHEASPAVRHHASPRR